MAKTPPPRPPARPATRPTPPDSDTPERDDPDTTPAGQDDPGDAPPAPDVDAPNDPAAAPPRMPARSEPPPREPDARVPVRVRATRDGYYGEKYRRVGDVFTLAPGDRLGKWMEAVDPATPERTTSHGEALQEQREEIMTQRAIERGRAPGVQPAIDNPDDGLDPIGAREG